MDNNTNDAQVQRGVSEHNYFHILKPWPIDPKQADGPRMEWIWRKLQAEENALDDLTKEAGAAFIQMMLAPNILKWELEDNGIVMLSDIINGVSAQIHYMVWDNPPVSKVISAANELFEFAFNKFQLHRISAPIPSFNKEAKRLATLMGFKFEGEYREAYLKNGKFHNLSIYGLLDREYRKRLPVN
jgi:RimJ/RimL family protein N-acetyltransferase